MSEAREPAPLTVIDLWAENQRTLSALGRTIDDHDTRTHVPACPIWSVREVLAHQAGAAADILAGKLDDVGSDRWTAAQVDARADRSLAEILDEWDTSAVALAEALAPLGDDVDPRLLIDIWNHEQDVRGALARPGNRANRQARWVLGAMGDFVTGRWAEAGLAPIAMDFGQGATELPGGLLRVPPFEFARATVGRRSLTQVHAWHWEVDDPQTYSNLVPVFSPRDTELVEPGEEDP